MDLMVNQHIDGNMKTEENRTNVQMIVLVHAQPGGKVCVCTCVRACVRACVCQVWTLKLSLTNKISTYYVHESRWALKYGLASKIVHK